MTISGKIDVLSKMYVLQLRTTELEQFCKKVFTKLLSVGAQPVESYLLRFSFVILEKGDPTNAYHTFRLLFEKSNIRK